MKKKILYIDFMRRRKKNLFFVYFLKEEIINFEFSDGVYNRY